MDLTGGLHCISSSLLSVLQIGVMEALIGSALVGMVYAALSGQPLSIMGITGPTALFEGLVYFVTRHV